MQLKVGEDGLQDAILQERGSYVRWVVAGARCGRALDGQTKHSAEHVAFNGLQAATYPA